jgi:hypothetical protein
VRRIKQFLLLASLGFVSCVSLESRARAPLVGDWRFTDKVQSCHYSFNRDGTFTGEVTVKSKLVSKFNGRWSVDNDALLYTYLGDALGRIPAGATDRDRLLEVRPDWFRIEAADGSQRRYVRER